MTVKELKEILNSCSDDAQVVVVERSMRVTKNSTGQVRIIVDTDKDPGTQTVILNVQ